MRHPDIPTLMVAGVLIIGAILIYHLVTRRTR